MASMNTAEPSISCRRHKQTIAHNVRPKLTQLNLTMDCC